MFRYFVQCLVYCLKISGIISQLFLEKAFVGGRAISITMEVQFVL